MISTKQREIVEKYIEAFNAYDVEAMLQFVHPDVVYKNVVGEDTNAIITGIDEFRIVSERVKSYYSARREQITGLESVGDITTVDIAFEAVLAVDSPNGRKAGDIDKGTGRSVYEFLDGKIYRMTDYIHDIVHKPEGSLM